MLQVWHVTRMSYAAQGKGVTAMPRRKSTLVRANLVWSPDGARLNTHGASIDLGVITWADAQKLAFLNDAVLRERKEEASPALS